MPTESKTFWVFVLMSGTGAWLGFLSGIGVISYDAFVGIAFFAFLPVFVLWAIWNTDPSTLKEDSDSG
jgi:hypothetical protein